METTRNILDLGQYVGRAVDIVYATGGKIGDEKVRRRTDKYTLDVEKVTTRPPYKGLRTRAVSGVLTGVYGDRVTLDPSTIKHLHTREPSGKERKFDPLPYKEDGTVPLAPNIRSIDTLWLRWENPGFGEYLLGHRERKGL